MTEVKVMRPARMTSFYGSNFGTPGCSRLLLQYIVFMKTVNPATKLANLFHEQSARSIILIQSVRKPLQRKSCHVPGKLWQRIHPAEGVGSHSTQHCCVELDEAGAENRRRWGRTGIGVTL